MEYFKEDITGYIGHNVIEDRINTLSAKDKKMILSDIRYFRDAKTYDKWSSRSCGETDDYY